MIAPKAEQRSANVTRYSQHKHQQGELMHIYCQALELKSAVETGEVDPREAQLQMLNLIVELAFNAQDWHLERLMQLHKEIGFDGGEV